MKNPFTILFLAANPDLTEPLRLDREAKAIREALHRSKLRDRFRLEQRWAANTDDLRRALLDVRPRLVHFSGHGHPDGIALEDELKLPVAVGGPALAELFGMFSDCVETVVLNACSSEKQAEVISRCVRHVIGMNTEVNDKTTLKFAVGFYDGLGAGLAMEDAFRLGVNALRLDKLPGDSTPVLKTNPSIPVPRDTLSGTRPTESSMQTTKKKAKKPATKTSLALNAGSGAIAQGNNAIAVGAGGTVIKGPVRGNISARNTAKP